jgi:hypothetical protein
MHDSPSCKELYQQLTDNVVSTIFIFSPEEEVRIHPAS